MLLGFFFFFSKNWLKVAVLTFQEAALRSLRWIPHLFLETFFSLSERDLWTWKIYIFFLQCVHLIYRLSKAHLALLWDANATHHATLSVVPNQADQWHHQGIFLSLTSSNLIRELSLPHSKLLVCPHSLCIPRVKVRWVLRCDWLIRQYGWSLHCKLSLQP